VKSCFVAALGTLLSAAIASAQSTRVTLDVSGARMRYADTVDATALSLSPELSARLRRVSFSATGMLSQLGSATTMAGAFDGSVFPSGRGRFTTELELRAGGSHHSDGARTAELLAMGRFHATAVGKGAWLGAGVGRTWDGDWRQILRGDAGAWLADGSRLWSLVANPTSVDDSIRYLDAVLSFDRESDRIDVSASVGARAGDRIPTLPANRTLWGGASVVYWMTSSTAIVASAGSYPVDFTQGYPGGRYASLGLRFSPRRSSISALPAPREQTSSALRRFEAETVGDSVRLRVLAPDAGTVEISGDFTEWDPMPLQRAADGWWTGTVRVPPGTHQMNVRVNAGNWLVPPGLTPITDEFGVVSGLLVVDK
jgi:hypothetical protein